MTLELSDDEVALLIQSLRGSEYHSKLGFMRSMEKKIHTLTDEELLRKRQKFVQICECYVRLRHKLGDDTPVDKPMRER